MRVREIFVPAAISKLRTIDSGEIRLVELTLPREAQVGETSYPIADDMRPGTAFLAKPFGARTGRVRRRMYTRSNCALDSALALETIVNDTHEASADTSVWWQTPQAEELYAAGETIPVKVALNAQATALVPYENCSVCGDDNLRLEPDDQWPHMKFLAVAFSTGITPFLAHVRYMQAFNFGSGHDRPGAHVILVVSVRTPNQLMAHRELCDLHARFPMNFHYYPVLTRVWPDDWAYGRGRIIRVATTADGGERIDLSSLLDVVPDVRDRHVRMCGNAAAREQLSRGLQECGVVPLSFRTEAW